jgi:hypothetical protein
MPAGTGLGQSGGSGGMTPSELARLEYLEDNEYKITYWSSISSDSGAITKPTGSTIILDSFMSGVDALVETIVNGKPSGFSPVTAGGAYVTVSSFDTSGNYTLSGTPSATPVALLYIVTIPGDQYQNLDNDNVITAEPVNPIVQTITNGDTTHAPSSDAVYDALALKTNQMQCSGAIANLSASQTYYFGINPTLATSTSTVGRVFTFGNTGTINKVIIQITLTGTVGSNHSCDVYLRNITAGTETNLGTITYDQGSNTTTAFTFTPSISIPNTTDFWSVKIVTGAFTTAPTSVYHNARIFNTN